jgi:alcohol-forming fatty acyl-CoA reductase
MVHVQKRISVGMEVLQFFTMRKWNFKSDNFEALVRMISPEEEAMFTINSAETGDEYEYVKDCLLGARQYCVKDPLSTIPKARIQLKM